MVIAVIFFMRHFPGFKLFFFFVVKRFTTLYGYYAMCIGIGMVVAVFAVRYCSTLFEIDNLDFMKYEPWLDVYAAILYL